MAPFWQKLTGFIIFFGANQHYEHNREEAMKKESINCKYF